MYVLYNTEHCANIFWKPGCGLRRRVTVKIASTPAVFLGCRNRGGAPLAYCIIFPKQQRSDSAVIIIIIISEADAAHRLQGKFVDGSSLSVSCDLFLLIRELAGCSDRPRAVITSEASGAHCSPRTVALPIAAHTLCDFFDRSSSGLSLQTSDRKSVG